MDTKIIISANGPNKSGIVSELSKKINLCNGNIETSRMIQIENEFSILVMISIPKEKINKLKDEINNIKYLRIDITELSIINKDEYNYKYHLLISGADNEGIVYQFSKLLSSLKINIEEINTNIINAPVSGTPIFMMDAIIGSISIIDESDFQDKLNAIAERLGVEANLVKI